jgi:hypothetical protein
MSSPSLPELLDGVEQLRSAYAAPSIPLTMIRQISVSAVIDALGSFTEIVRYLNTRRSSGAILELKSEADVQDALYLMLRPWIMDLVPENPTDKVANKYNIKDFISQTGKFVIEAKYIRTADHGKSIAKEINDDIETYRYHAACDDLIFFIYDPEGFIPDSVAVERHVRTARTYDGKVLRCHGVIKP